MSWINNWYFLLLFFSILINLLSAKFINKYDRYIFTLLIFFTIIAISYRPLTFNDDDNYVSMIKDFKYMNVDELGKISSLFYYLNIIILKFTNNYNLVLRINFILIWIILFLTFFIEKIKNKTLYFTFLLMIFQVLFFIQLRNAFAIVFLNWGIIRYNKNKPSIFLFVLSLLFHYSVLPFLFVFFLLNKLINKSKKFMISKQFKKFFLAIIISFFFYNIYVNYIIVLPFFEIYFLDFISSPEVGNTSILQLILLLVHIALFIPLSNKYYENLQLTRSIFIIYYGLLLAIVFFSLPLFQRIIIPFYLYSIITLLYIIIKYSRKSLNRYFYYVMLLIYFFISMNRVSYFENWYII